MDTNLKDSIIHKYVQEKKSCKTIGKELNVSHTFVYEKLKECGVELRKSNFKHERISDKYKDEIIDMYLNDRLSVLKIAKILNISQYTIYDGLKAWGVKRRDFNEMTGYTANYNFFDKIDSEAKAYWLGFMYADGYISNDGYVGISLSIKDKSHLEKYRKELNCTYKIHDYMPNETNKYTKNKYSRLTFKNKYMCDVLNSKGCFYNKSLKLIFPDENIVPKALLKHFIRGYFDGDGSLITSKNSINFKICGTKEFLEGIIDTFNENIEKYNFKKSLYKRRDDNKNNFYISYGGRLKTIEVMKWLYEDSSIYLDRKYELYLNLLNI